MYGLVMDEDECTVMVLKWDYGISSYGMNIWKRSKSRRYGDECMKLEIKVLNECMVLQLRFWMKEWYYKLRIDSWCIWKSESLACIAIGLEVLWFYQNKSLKLLWKSWNGLYARIIH